MTAAGGPVAPSNFDIGQAARGYGIANRVVDYGPHRGGGMLVHNGAGIALAVMDALPELRWVVDFSGLRQPVGSKLRWFLDCASGMSTLNVAALVFFADDPDAARDALHHIRGTLVCLSNLDLGRTPWVRDFDELAVQAEKARKTLAPGLRVRGVTRPHEGRSQ